MKKFLILLVIPAILISFVFVDTASVAFAQQEGYDVRGEYQAEIVFGYFNLANGRILQSCMFTLDKNFIAQFDEDALLDKDSLLNYVSAVFTFMDFETETDENGRVVGTIIYESLTDIYIERERDGYEVNASDYEEESTFFFRNIYSRQDTIFKKVEGKETFIDVILSKLFLYDLSSEDIALSYHYGTPYKIISTDAEKSYFDINYRIYVHEFQMDISTSGREILIVQKTPNTTNWYLIAIAISLPFIITSLLIGLFIKRKEKRERGY